MKPTSSFATLLQRFFTQRLMQQRQARPHTISSYRDTFRLLLQFALKRLHMQPARVAFEDIDAPLISAFLDELQNSRGISARSRNIRLCSATIWMRAQRQSGWPFWRSRREDDCRGATITQAISW
jgi:site-specific recombinase XerC